MGTDPLNEDVVLDLLEAASQLIYNAPCLPLQLLRRFEIAS